VRFLRARAFNPSKALDLVRADLTWREERGIHRFADMAPEDVLGCDHSLMEHYLPTYIGASDKQGRPVVISKQGDFVVDSVLMHIPVENLHAYHVWQQEQVGRRLREQSVACGARVSQIVAVVDMKNWHLGLMTRQAMDFVKEQVRTDNVYYAERAGTAFLINVPYVFSLCWNLIKPLLDKATNDKIKIFSSEVYWKPALAELIDPSELPKEYGGTNDVYLRDITVPAAEPAVKRVVSSAQGSELSSISAETSSE